MEIATKNKIGAAGFGLILLGGAVYWGIAHWPDAWRGKGHGMTVDKALATDLTPLDDAGFVSFISDLSFTGAGQNQRLALADKLKAYFDNMGIIRKFTMMMAMRKYFEGSADSPFVGNVRILMQAYWNREIKDYMKADAQERRKMLDERIDDQVAMENIQKIQNAAQSLFSGPATTQAATQTGLDANGMPDLNLFRGFMAQAIQDGFVNTPPEDRAAGTQYMLDMRQERINRGLPVMY